MQPNVLLLYARAILATTSTRWLALTESLPTDLLTRPPAHGHSSAAECLRHLLDAEQADQPRSGEEVAIPPTASIKCTFLGVVPIGLKRFAESGVILVECPDCGRTWTLSPRGGVVRFKAHDKRKSPAPVTGVRWALRATIWTVVGREHA